MPDFSSGRFLFLQLRSKWYWEGKIQVSGGKNTKSNEKCEVSKTSVFVFIMVIEQQSAIKFYLLLKLCLQQLPWEKTGIEFFLWGDLFGSCLFYLRKKICGQISWACNLASFCNIDIWVREEFIDRKPIRLAILLSSKKQEEFISGFTVKIKCK